MNRVLFALAIAGMACAQFSDLAVTDDGRQIYFATSLRLRSEAGENLSGTRTIYRYTDAGVERFATPLPSRPLSLLITKPRASAATVRWWLTPL